MCVCVLCACVCVLGAHVLNCHFLNCHFLNNHFLNCCSGCWILKHGQFKKRQFKKWQRNWGPKQRGTIIVVKKLQVKSPLIVYRHFLKWHFWKFHFLNCHFLNYYFGLSTRFYACIIYGPLILIVIVCS